MKANGKVKRQFLTEDEQFSIYEFCRKNHCIIQLGSLVKFRWQKAAIIDEINKTDLFPTRKISLYHLDTSLATVTSWQARFDLEINTRETAEVEQIKEQHTRDVNQIEMLKLKVEELTKQLAEASAVEGSINDLKQRLAKIRREATI